ncbi:MAG TPA: hypothetical protein VFB14_23315 [Bryobacteraceae bacterium]|nr:hypothetical protein [Bryobacteraceae bacterium]
MNSTARNTKIQRLWTVGLFLFVLAYQLRSSIETIHLARHLDYWIPFSLEPLSDRMEAEQKP